MLAFITCRKYSMVFASPTRTGTFGLHPIFSFAVVMSGRRCLGSSFVAGKNLIVELDPVISLISTAKS
jgi:hypothetical protein